jgi:ornithine--oxo-acid transaminase
MMSAYSAASFGHLHPRLVHAMKRQLERLDIVSRAYHSDNLGPLCEELAGLAGLDACLPMNTGAEAVETAIKAARRYGYDRLSIPGGKAEIIVAAGNFHGRTTSIIGFSSEPSYRRGFGLSPGFVTVPFGDLPGRLRRRSRHSRPRSHRAHSGRGGRCRTARGYLQASGGSATAGILLIFDEVQSGFGRTGRNFCFEHENAKPDGLIVGKALGGGLMPVSAFVARRAVMDVFDPGSHGSTFGGNPLAAAVAREAIHVLQDEDLALRSRVLGKTLLAALAGIGHPAIVEVRGKGLWAGVELDPARASAKKVCLAMLRRGVLTKETHETVIRFAPPLIIEEDDLLQAVEIFHDALEETVAPHGLTSYAMLRRGRTLISAQIQSVGACLDRPALP